VSITADADHVYADGAIVADAEDTTPKGHNMKQSEFIALCTERLVDPSLAIENDAIREALQSGDRAKIVEALDNEF